MVCEAFGGGVFAYVSQLCNDMVESFDVYLAYSVRSQTPKDYRSRIDGRVKLVELDTTDGWLSFVGFRRVVRCLRHLRDEIDPDIIHLHSSIAGAVGRVAFTGKDRPLVYTPHGYAHVLMGPGMKSGAYLLAEKVLGMRDAITLTCCESENAVAKTLCRKTAYVETGLNVSSLDKALKGVVPVRRSGRFTVFTLGRACAQKRPSLFNQIARQVPEADFTWIGGGELEGELDAPNMTVTGWMPREDALALAKGADAFVLCSYGEAIAMSLLENMYLGKLVLASDVMGNSSVIEDGVNGYLCGSAEEFACRIWDAMDEYPEDVARRARESVLTTYNTDVMRQKYIRFYESLLVG